MPVKGPGIEKTSEATKTFAAAANDVKSMKNLDDEGQKKVFGCCCDYGNSVHLRTIYITGT